MPTSAPAASIPITLNLHHNVHALLSEEVDGPLANILKIRASRSDDMNYSKDGLLFVLMFMFMLMVVMMVMAVAVVMMMVMMMTMTVIMVVVMIVVMIMRMTMALGD